MTDKEIIQTLERKLNEAYEVIGVDRITIRRYEIERVNFELKIQELTKRVQFFESEKRYVYFPKSTYLWSQSTGSWCAKKHLFQDGQICRIDKSVAIKIGIRV